MFRCSHSYRRLLSDEACKCDRFLETLVRSINNFADKAPSESLSGIEETCGVSQLTGPRLIADDFLESLEGSDVSCKANIHFLDRELGIRGANSNITS